MTIARIVAAIVGLLLGACGVGWVLSYLEMGS